MPKILLQNECKNIFEVEEKLLFEVVDTCWFWNCVVVKRIINERDACLSDVIC